ncbi:protein-tyrosine phosphatase [Novosphingobium sp. PhB165]|uniref:tyrosine-protein phosphatase n=1 Tax=Novosphingobium sp. PhB165 TaxID=2485105 RepID=UPI00104CB6C4|nr:tyrosine-protein phosphatase [Novosphingobium sp. PhB165]TCM18028.1 protein-tyrosine phosphatase [Novosphingobium sp. PhB165]
MKIRQIAILGAALVALSTPAFFAAQAAGEAPVTAGAPAAHQRLLPLEGGRNFRDLGGYRTADGHTVKWGLLFRSGSMVDLTAGDLAYLNKLGLKTVCDYRDKNERKAEPMPWAAGTGPTIFADDYDGMAIGLMPKDMAKITPEGATGMMAKSYPMMLKTFGPQYKRMFAQLLAGQAPLAFNCSAGKDRTGVSAALLLTALGVPRETVIQDYLLTNQYLPAAMAKAKTSPNAATGQAFLSLPPAVQSAFMKADRSYIEAALSQLDAHPGGAMGYFKDEMGMDQAQIDKLRAMYLD